MSRNRQNIPVKNRAQLEKMKAACKITGDALKAVEQAVRPGITTFELDAIASAFILNSGALPAFYGYNGFPANTCISVNEQLIHGIPCDRTLDTGDIVSIDLGAVLDGFYGDAARTFKVGAVPDDLDRLVETAERAFYEACRLIKSGLRVGDISHAIQSFCEKRGYGVVKDFVGHGIGLKLHEPPQIPNYGSPETGPVIPAGATLAIEPMITMGSSKVKVLDDGWTVVTADGMPCAHYENTVFVTDNGCKILTE